MDEVMNVREIYQIIHELPIDSVISISGSVGSGKTRFCGNYLQHIIEQDTKEKVIYCNTYEVLNGILYPGDDDLEVELTRYAYSINNKTSVIQIPSESSIEVSQDLFKEMTSAAIASMSPLVLIIDETTSNNMLEIALDIHKSYPKCKLILVGGRLPELDGNVEMYNIYLGMYPYQSKHSQLAMTPKTQQIINNFDSKTYFGVYYSKEDQHVFLLS